MAVRYGQGLSQGVERETSEGVKQETSEKETQGVSARRKTVQVVHGFRLTAPAGDEGETCGWVVNGV